MNAVRIISLLIDIALVAALFVGVTTYLFFLYESKNAGEFTNLRNKFRDRLPKTILKALGMSIGSQLLVYLAYLLGLFPSFFFLHPKSGKNPPRPDKPAILLIHGLYHNVSAWLLFKWRLRRAGFRNIYAFSYASWNTDFFEIRRELEGFVDAIQQTHRDSKIFIVGHSLGGLLGRSLLATTTGRDAIGGVVTWGAPHRGSKLAAVALGRLGRSLEFQGDLIKTIEAEEKKPESACLSLYSPVDNFVLPTSGLRIRTAGWREVETAAMCHVAMLYHPEPAETTIDFLKNQRADG